MTKTHVFQVDIKEVEFNSGLKIFDKVQNELSITNKSVAGRTNQSALVAVAQREKTSAVKAKDVGSNLVVEHLQNGIHSKDETSVSA